MENPITEQESEHLKNNLGLLEFKIKERAYWTIMRKYFKVLFASIFAIILAKPEIVQKIHPIVFSFPELLVLYFGVGVAGLINSEFNIAYYEMMNGTVDERKLYPTWVKKVVFSYFMVGVLIFLLMLLKLMNVK